MKNVLQESITLPLTLYTSVQSQPNTVVFSASFYKTHSSKHAFGKPITVWECDVFEPNIVFFQCSLLSLTNCGANALLVCPCIDF